MEENYKPWPELKTDEEAEEFVANSDLTEYDWSDFKRVQFKFPSKREEIRLSLPEKLIKAINEKAEIKNLSISEYIENILAHAIAQ